MKNLLLISAIFLMFISASCSTPAFSDDELNNWQNNLSGRIWQHYRSIYIGGNYSYEKTGIAFCPDGRVAYQDFYTGYIFEGTWTVSRNQENTPLLIIQNDQKAMYFALTIEDGNTYFKGSEYAPISEPAACN